MLPRVCFKAPYDTPQAAQQALRQIKQRKRRDHRPEYERKAYHCEHCGKYHLTKMNGKTDRTLKHRRTEHEV